MRDLIEISLKIKPKFLFKPKQMAALPGVTKKDREVIKYSGIEFYTNQKLRNKFMTSMMRFTPTKSHDTLIKLINKKKLIPAFLTKSTFDWYVKNSLDPEQDEHQFHGVLGFYTPKTNTIFILIDVGYKVLGWVPDKHLCAVTLHEAMHFAAKKDSRKFLQINIKAFYDYYSEFLKIVYETRNVDKKALVEWITYIHRFETSKGKVNLNMKDYTGKIVAAIKDHTKLSNKDIDIRNSYLWSYVVGTYSNSGSQQMNIIRKYRNIYSALMDAYKKAFGFTARTLAYQELFTSSEVICILASMELGKNKYVSDSLDIIV